MIVFLSSFLAFFSSSLCSIFFSLCIMSLMMFLIFPHLSVSDMAFRTQQLHFFLFHTLPELGFFFHPLLLFKGLFSDPFISCPWSYCRRVIIPLMCRASQRNVCSVVSPTWYHSAPVFIDYFLMEVLCLISHAALLLMLAPQHHHRVGTILFRRVL